LLELYEVAAIYLFYKFSLKLFPSFTLSEEDFYKKTTRGALGFKQKKANKQKHPSQPFGLLTPGSQLLPESL